MCIDVFHDLVHSVFSVAASQSAVDKVIKHVDDEMFRSVVVFLNEAVVLAVIEMLLQEVAWIINLIINNFTAFHNRNDVRVDEAAVWFQSESFVTCLHFFVEVEVNLHSVSLDETFAFCVVAFRLNTLNLSEQVAKQATEFLIVVDDEVCLAVANNSLDDVVFQTFLIAPPADESAVLHVSLSDVLAEFDTCELAHETVADEVGILCLVALHVRKDAEFHHLRIGAVIQSKEVGACFFESRAVFLQSVLWRCREQLT